MVKSRIERLDIIRGISILLVFVFHFSQLYIDSENARMYDQSFYIPQKIIKLFIISPLGQGGTLGVFLFFILSGFLIHLKYDYKFTLSWSDFYYKRFWRIVPIYWAVLLLFFFFYITVSEQKIYDLFIHFFFLHNLDSNTFYSIDPSFWSLAVEVQFYLLFPVLVMLYRKFGIIKISFFFLLISILIQFIPALDKISILSTFKFLYVWLFGGLIAIYKDKIKIFFVSTIQLVILSSLIILYAVYVLFFSNVFNVSIYYVFSFCLSLAIFLNIFFTDHKVLNAVLLNKFSKIFVFLGACSYSLYLIHQPLLGVIHKHSFGLFKNVGLSYFIDFFLITFIIIVLSYAFYRIFEKGFINLGYRLKK